MGKASNVVHWPDRRPADEELSDADLVEAWQRGEEREAVAEALYHRHARRIFALFRRLGLSVEVSEEQMQEAFAKAFDKLDAFRGDSAFGTWLHKIARNQARRFLRDAAALKRAGQNVPIEADARDDEEDHHAALLLDEAEGPEFRLIRQERLDRLRQVIAELPAQRRQMLSLRLDQHRSDREIALLLKIPVGTVKSRMSDTRRVLRDALARYYPTVGSRD